MTKGTALLVLGAILLIVTGLVGDGGIISRIAGMNQDQIEGAVDEVGMRATQSAGFSATAADDNGIVRPTVVGEAEPSSEIESGFVDDMQTEVEADPPVEGSSAAPHELDTTGFDPRIG